MQHEQTFQQEANSFTATPAKRSCYFKYLVKLQLSNSRYLVKVYDEIAGFVLLNKATEDATNTWNMSEFFIIAKFQGAGKSKAVRL